MNKSTYKKLVKDAKKIERLWKLKESEKWFFPLLNQRITTAISVLDVIKESEKSYQEIADKLDINQNTAKRIISALIEGGLSIKDDGIFAIASTGRPRKLKKFK